MSKDIEVKFWTKANECICFGYQTSLRFRDVKAFEEFASKTRIDGCEEVTIVGVNECDEKVLTIRKFKSLANTCKLHRTVVADEDYMTFILEDTFENGCHISTEVIGFYYGQPDTQNTLRYAHELKATF